jgi:hypothetical protein
MTEIPSCAWKRAFNEKFEKKSMGLKLSPLQILKWLPVFSRMRSQIARERKLGSAT